MILKVIVQKCGTTMQYFNSIPHGNKPVMGFMPSVTFGAGYDLITEKGWLRTNLAPA